MKLDSFPCAAESARERYSRFSVFRARLESEYKKKISSSLIRWEIDSVHVAELLNHIASSYVDVHPSLFSLLADRLWFFTPHSPWSYFSAYAGGEDPFFCSAQAVLTEQMEGYYYSEGFFSNDSGVFHHAWISTAKGKAFEMSLPSEVWRQGGVMAGFVFSTEELSRVYSRPRATFDLLSADVCTVESALKLIPSLLFEKNSRSVLERERTNHGFLMSQHGQLLHAQL